MDGTPEPGPGGSAGKFQRLADEETSGLGPRIRKVPSKDSYEYNAAPHQAQGSAFPFEGGNTAPQPLTVRRWSSSKRKSSVSDAVGDTALLPGGFDLSDTNSIQRHSEESPVQFGLEIPDRAEGHGVHFREDSKPGDGSSSFHRKGSAGGFLVATDGGSFPGSKSCDGSSQGGGSTRVSFGADSPDSVPSSCWPPQTDPISGGGVKFTEDTKPGPSLGRTPSIQRKGTPGLALMSGLADVAAEVSEYPDAEQDMPGMSSQEAPASANTAAGHTGRRAMFQDDIPGDSSTRAHGVKFMEDSSSGPRFQRSASAIQRKATPGLVLMSGLADMADHVAEHSVQFSADTDFDPIFQKSSSLLRKGTPGVALMTGLADMAAEVDDGGESDMQTVPAVQFTPDTKPGPSFGRSPSIQRKGTPGVSLMSDMADIAAEVQNTDWADDCILMKSAGSVQFSSDTQLAARSLQRSASSIQRRSTPGVALMSELADFANSDQAMESDDEDEHDDNPFRPGVKFSQETKSGPSFGRSASSIRRAGTPGVALMSDAADIAAEIQSYDKDDACRPSPGVSFGEGTKLEPTGSTIQRKGTPGKGLMSDLADIASDLETPEDAMAHSGSAVRFAEGVKPGPSLQRISSSIQRKGTPGVALMSDMADMAAECEGDRNVDMQGFPAVHFSEGTKQEPAFGRVPSIQRKGTPGAGLMSDLAGIAADLEDGDDCMGDGHSVRFSDNTNFGPTLQRSSSSIQRKGTPGVALMSDLADFAAEAVDEAGDHEMTTSSGGVRFAEDTKAEPAFGRTPSIQRRATPGCTLGADTDSTAAEPPEPVEEAMVGGVRFSADTKPEPSLKRGPSIQRKSTPGCGLMSDLADFAAEEQEAQELQVPFTEEQSSLPRRSFMKMKSASQVDYVPPDERLRNSRFSLTSDSLVRPPDLGQVGEELSAIFGRPAAPGANSPSIVAPVARRVSMMEAQHGADESLEVAPRMMSDTTSLYTRGRFLSRNSSLSRPSPTPPTNPSDDTSMEGLTAAMAELGHPAFLQRQG